MKSFTHFIRESIIDPIQPTFAPDVFDATETPNPKMKPVVRQFILDGIKQISEYLKVLDYEMIGSVTTKRYAPDSDLDINLLVDLDGKQKEDIWKITSDMSGKTAPGGLHPVNYHAIFERAGYDHAHKMADGAYDLKGDKFSKISGETPFDIRNYFGKFREIVKKINLMTSDLKADLIDYQQLKTIPVENLKELQKLLNDELKELEKSANGLVDIHKKIAQDRRDAFAKPLSAEDIKEYGTKNRLPENVVYKLLERYHYLDLLKRIEEIIGPDKKLSPAEADQLAQVVK